MTPLSMIADAARRTLGHLPQARQEPLKAALVESCLAHWPAMRGAMPGHPLARALWEVSPHLCLLFMHQWDQSDPSLLERLEHLSPERALALLALAEIERGDPDGAASACEAMRLFGSPAARELHVRAVLDAFGRPEADDWLRHSHHPPLWRGVAELALRSGRWDGRAVMEGLRQVAQAQSSPGGASDDPDMAHVLERLARFGLRFQVLEDKALAWSAHGKEPQPLSFRQVCEILAEARQQRQRMAGPLNPA
ncbi:MAG: hypothetical protein RJA36_105 [Pseudomonadota bacterium]|jgi:hypothetical protein